ncbi:hypothetical protein [Bradyrhizobium murdochi]|uniref:hypothetical protein n=1 Tax=Bradyrhizobium murdochi TaxID=1038859 RepID=UPI0012EB4C25|nr:hypothetical protein [Bradyrhizobium murdochi]
MRFGGEASIGNADNALCQKSTPDRVSVSGSLYKAEIVFTNIAFRSSDKEPLAMTSLLIAFPVPEMAAPRIACGILP